MTDEATTLEQRVAALEALACPQITLNGPPWELSPEEMDRLRADIEKAVQQPLRIIPPPPALSPDEVRQLLSECVTVIKPGEVLILRGRDGWTPEQVGEVHRAAAVWLEENAPAVRALAVPPMEIAVMPAGEAGAMTRGGFLNDCRIDTFRNSAETSFRITHLPTGVEAEGGWDEAVAELGRELLQRGGITVNDARAAMGLRPFEYLGGEPA